MIDFELFDAGTVENRCFRRSYAGSALFCAVRAGAVVDALFALHEEAAVKQFRRRLYREEQVENAAADAADKVPVGGGVAVVMAARVLGFQRQDFAVVGELADVAVDGAKADIRQDFAHRLIDLLGCGMCRGCAQDAENDVPLLRMSHGSPPIE